MNVVVIGSGIVGIAVAHALLDRQHKVTLVDADVPAVAASQGNVGWMGFRPLLPDSLPVIGRSPGNPRLIHAFGHADHRLTQAAVTAEVVAMLVTHERPGIEMTPFQPGRFR